jgi:hypothetical protein
LSLANVEGVSDRISGGLGAVGAARLRENIVDVSRDRALADRQCDGDVGVASADCKQLQNFRFPWGQVIWLDRS